MDSNEPTPVSPAPSSPIVPSPSVAPSLPTSALERMFSGRLGRLGYFISIVYILLGYIIFSFLAVAIGDNGFLAVLVRFLILLVGFVVVVGSIPLGFALQARRWRDLNQSAWLCLLVFVPLVNVITGLVLLFAPGTAGPNSQGVPYSGSLSWKDVFGFRN
jgi:uncharacterized membrane protein YhaH (DUF805 family)